MGVRTSRMGSAPSHGVRSPQRRRPMTKRAVSSFLICGASSSSSTHETEEYQDGLLVNCAEFSDGKKLKHKGNGYDLSPGSVTAFVDIEAQNRVTSGRCLTHNENLALETCSNTIGSNNEEECMSECRELVHCQSMVVSRVNDTASTSFMDQPCPDSAHATEIVNLDVAQDIKNMNADSSQSVEALSNSTNFPSHGLTESLCDELSVDNNPTEEMDFSDSEYGFSSVVSESPIEFSLMRGDGLHEVIPSPIGFLAPERERNRRLIQGDLMGVSSNNLSSNSSERGSRGTRRNNGRLFWDAFSRHSPLRDSVSRGLHFTSNESDDLRSHGRLLLDVSGDLISDERQGDIRSRESRAAGSNVQLWNSRSEIMESFRDGLDSNDLRIDGCPRRIHVAGSCPCRSSLLTEESPSRAISRIVLLAQALFEVLDHIHQQPTPISLPVAALPAPKSVVDSFPVKIHTKENVLESAEDISQCYICLANYEEGDKIRVLPCNHEYHMSCVDKWLHEFHGVCPLCRGDVRQGSTEASISDREILSH